MEEKQKEKQKEKDCPNCKKTIRIISYIEYNYCPYCRATLPADFSLKI